MKKFLCILAAFMTLFMTACQTSESISAEADSEPIAAASESEPESDASMTISGLYYPDCGAIADFQISGTLTSSEGLERIEVSGQIKSDALGINVSTDPEAYSFDEEVTTIELSELNDDFVDQLTGLYDLYAVAAGIVGADDSAVVTIDCICCDAVGRTVSFTIDYEIVSE